MAFRWPSMALDVSSMTLGVLPALGVQLSFAELARTLSATGAAALAPSLVLLVYLLLQVLANWWPSHRRLLTLSPSGIA